MVNNTTLDDGVAFLVCKSLVQGVRKDLIASRFDTNLVTVERLEMDNDLQGSAQIFNQYLQGKSTKVLAKKFGVNQRTVKQIVGFGL